jgi:hypothetical protein
MPHFYDSNPQRIRNILNENPGLVSAYLLEGIFALNNGGQYKLKKVSTGMMVNGGVMLLRISKLQDGVEV